MWKKECELQPAGGAVDIDVAPCVTSDPDAVCTVSAWPPAAATRWHSGSLQTETKANEKPAFLY